MLFSVLHVLPAAEISGGETTVVRLGGPVNEIKVHKWLKPIGSALGCTWIPIIFSDTIGRKPFV